MDNLDYLKEQKSGLNYLIRKYGRITLILSILILVIIEFTGVRSQLATNVKFETANSSVVIQGSKKVNPSVTSEYWTGNKFNF